jgi:hypothetical protein
VVIAPELSIDDSTEATVTAGLRGLRFVAIGVPVGGAGVGEPAPEPGASASGETAAARVGGRERPGAQVWIIAPGDLAVGAEDEHRGGGGARGDARHRAGREQDDQGPAHCLDATFAPG